MNTTNENTFTVFSDTQAHRFVIQFPKRSPETTEETVETYVGMTQNGLKAGRATCEYKNGIHYGGFFRRNKRHGVGRLTFGFNEYYNGGWDMDKRDCGSYHYANGDFYTGLWKDDAYEGSGMYSWVSGHKYNGNWKNGLPNGYGVFMFPCGDEVAGVYKMGMHQICNNAGVSKSKEQKQ
jgi:hypothetical protein